MKKIVFLGYIIPPEEAAASVAGNKMQWNMLRYLSQWEDIEVSCVTVTPMASFPCAHKIWSTYRIEEIFPGVLSHRVDFCNLPVIKQLWQTAAVYRKAKKVIRQTGADTVLTFNLFPQIGIPMRLLKRKYGVDTICLLADLPIDDTPNRGAFSRWLRNKFDKSTWKSMMYCDRYIALNEYAMQTYLPGKPYTIIDGGIEPSEYPEETIGWNGKEKNIIYTGALVDYSGIMNLIAAMALLKDNSIVLDIYGDGALRPEIEAIAAHNPKIRYHGRVSNQEAMAAQQSAWLLANPRPTQSHIAQVTFPSKIFEYLMSGRPVMTTRLNGFSADYDQLLFWVEGNTPESLAEQINAINCMEDSALTQRAKDARTYLLNNKTWEQNARKVHTFLFNTLGENNEPNCQASK